MLQLEGKHPYTELMKLLPNLEFRDQMQVWLQLLSYCFPKPKDQDDQEDDISKMSDQELVQLIKQRLPEVDKAG